MECYKLLVMAIRYSLIMRRLCDFILKWFIFNQFMSNQLFCDEAGHVYCKQNKKMPRVIECTRESIDFIMMRKKIFIYPISRYFEVLVCNYFMESINYRRFFFVLRNILTNKCIWPRSNGLTSILAPFQVTTKNNYVIERKIMERAWTM